MKKAAIFVLVMVVITLLQVGCNLINSKQINYADLFPENPDPTPADKNDTFSGDYSIYANIDNEIWSVKTSNPSLASLIVTDLDPDNPQFFVTDDESYIVFSRSIGPNQEPGHFLVVKNLVLGIEVFLSKSNPTQSLVNEFDISGNNVVFSDNGNMKNYNLISTEYDDGLNSGDNHVCNHFMRLFTGDIMTFVDQIPGTKTGVINVIDYNGEPQVPIGPGYTSFTDFGTMLYPTVVKTNTSNNGLVWLTDSDRCNSLWIVSNYEASVTSSVQISCDDTPDVGFKSIYQTPLGTKILLYGYESIYWFENNGDLSAGSHQVSGKEFLATIHQVIASPDEAYFLVHDEHGIWIYDDDFKQLYCHFDWLNQENQVLWIDVNQP